MYEDLNAYQYIGSNAPGASGAVTGSVDGHTLAYNPS